jgi:hypothetical protein
MTTVSGEKMLRKMVQGKRMFVVLAGSIAALLGVGLASADIRGGMADALGDYYQARAGMAPVEAEVEHPIPAVAPQLSGLEAEDPADDEVEAKLEDDPEDEAEEAVEEAGGEQDDETQADNDDAQTDGDDDSDDDTDNKTSIPLPGGSHDSQADDDTDGAADAAPDEDSADTGEQDD